MARKSEQTYYDRWLGRLKDMPWFARLLGLVVGIAGLAALLTNVESILGAFRPKASGAPKIRAQYYTISGEAISLLLQGVLEPALQEHLGGTPIVWENEVYAEVRELHNRFAARPDPNLTEVYGDVDLAKLPPIARSAEVLEGSIGRQVLVYEADLLADPVLGNPLSTPGWKVAWRQDVPASDLAADVATGSISSARVIFSKRLECREIAGILQRLRRREAPFFEFVTSKDCSGLSVDIVAYYQPVGCGPEGWMGEIALPGLSLEVLVLQDISDEPIRVEDIELSATSIEGVGLPGPGEPTRFVKGNPGDGTLLPGERLLVPLSLGFSVSEDTEIGESNSVFSNPGLGSDTVLSMISTDQTIQVEAEEIELRRGGTERQSDGDDTPQMRPLGSIRLGTLESAYGFTPREPRGPWPFVGTRFEPRTVKVDGMEQQIHPVRLGEMYISNRFEGGSCPYLSIEEQDGRRTEVGKVLVFRNTEARRGTDSRRLPSWPSAIVLQERDPETTFLVGLQLTCEIPGGVVQKHGIWNADVVASGAPLRIGPGDTRTFPVAPLEADISCAEVYLSVEGYYLPETAPTQRTQ